MTPIKTLLDDPARFDGQVVRIAGTWAPARASWAMAPTRWTTARARSSVVSQGGGAPREGAKVGVEGTFKAVFTLGSRSVAVLMEKQRFTP